MKFIWIYILCCVFGIAKCAPTSTEEPSSTLEEIDDRIIATEQEVEEKEQQVHKETLEDLVDLGNEEIDLPILPPIILIDFTNGTNLTSEEKSKRTINGNLGYGFDRNNLFSGKYNYYFPAGKTGTTVSIEESISPFLPTTIIEKVNNPYPEKIYSNSNGNSYSNSNQNGGNKAPLAFGQRTRLYKSANDNFQSLSRVAPTQKPNYETYSTLRAGPGLGNYNNPTASYDSYTTPRPAVYNSPVQGQYNSLSEQNYKTYEAPRQSYGGISTNTEIPPNYKSISSGVSAGRGSYSGKQERPEVSQGYTTSKSQIYNPSQSQTTVLSPLGNSPRYTYENGIKYEHKIVWKYPNGMVSEIGPNSYDGTSSYSEYSNPTNLGQQSNFQSPEPANNFQKANGNGYLPNVGSIYSQKPATFPDNGNSGSGNSRPSQFVSSSSISNGVEYYTASTPRPTPPSQKYSFQDPYSVQNNAQLNQVQSSTPLPNQLSYNTNYNKPANIKNAKVVPNYPVSSNQEYTSFDNYSPPEVFESPDSAQASPYTYTQNSQITGSYNRQTETATPDPRTGKIQPNVLSKYTPQAQQYLKKALGFDESGQGQRTEEYENSRPVQDSYSNIQYSNLLDYNPSLSQYVRDPSSILNAQPTLIQAGNSLIPVIILRVDGVPPIQPKLTPNINLKALLQKYLTQYAQSLNQYSQGKNYEQDYLSPSSPTPSSTRLYDIARLTQSLGQLGPRSNFKQNFAQNFAHSVAQDYQPNSYSSIDNSNEAKYLSSSGSRETVSRKPAKVKNVQIIDDPRFTTYNVKKTN